MNAILLFSIKEYEIKLQKLVPTLIFIITLYLVVPESTINLAFTPSLSLLANIKQNKLSLKALEAKLNKLEQGNTVSTESGRSKLLPIMFLISGLLTFGTKIPIINRTVTLLRLWYGRTSGWEMLVKLRKGFLILNAIIGIITVFKVTGYSSDNWIAGFYGLGHTYVEMFTGFVRRLFNYFLDFFDYKVVPSVPKGPGSNNSWYWWGVKQTPWYTKPMVNDGFSKIIDLAKDQEFYNGPYGSRSNSTWSWFNIFYYGSIAILALGTLYLGIKIYNEVTHTVDYGKGKGVDFSNFPDHPINHGTSTLDSVTKLLGAATTSFMAFNKSVFSYLNPANYMMEPVGKGEAQEAFMARQQSANNYNTKYWPYTDLNPYDSYFNKWRIYLLGESLSEQELREQTARNYKNSMYVYGRMFPDTPPLGRSGASSPIGIGVAPLISDNSLVGNLEYSRVYHKINSLPTTPNEWTSGTKNAQLEAVNRILGEYAANGKIPLPDSRPESPTVVTSPTASLDSPTVQAQEMLSRAPSPAETVVPVTEPTPVSRNVSYLLKMQSGTNEEATARIKALGPHIMECAFPNDAVETLVAESINYFDDEFIEEMRERYIKKYGHPGNPEASTSK